MTTTVHLAYVNEAGDPCGVATLPAVEGCQTRTRLDTHIAAFLAERAISCVSFVRCYETITTGRREIWAVVWVNPWSNAYRLDVREEADVTGRRLLPDAVVEFVERHRQDGDCGRDVCGCPGWTRRAVDFARRLTPSATPQWPAITRYVTTATRTVLGIRWEEERVFLYGDSLFPHESAASWRILPRIASSYFPEVHGESADGRLLLVAPARGTELACATQINVWATLRDIAHVQQRVQEALAAGEPYPIACVDETALWEHLEWIDQFSDRKMSDDIRLRPRVKELLQWSAVALRGHSWVHTDLAVHNIFWDGIQCSFIDLTDSVITSPILAIPRFYSSLRGHTESSVSLSPLLMAYMAKWRTPSVAGDMVAYVVRNEPFIAFVDRLAESLRRARVTRRNIEVGYLQADLATLAALDHGHLMSYYRRMSGSHSTSIDTTTATRDGIARHRGPEKSGVKL